MSWIANSGVGRAEYYAQGFGVGLRIGGGFKAANDPFTKGVNTLNVNLMPESRLKKAIKAPSIVASHSTS